MLSNRRNTAILLILAVSLLPTGCYTFNPRGKSTTTTLAVEPFENQTPQYGLADLMTEAVVDAFIADGTMKVVSPEVAEAVLIGKLTRYERNAYEFDENDQVSRYKVLVGVDVALQNPSDRADIWSIQLTLDGIYDADSQTEEDGQRSVADQLVEAVLNKTTKSW